MPGSSLAALTPYVPPLVRRRLALGLAEVPHVDALEGAVLLADISGFTRMSERMAARGLEGAETFTHLLNAYFGRLIDCVDEYGGEVMGFTGDGLSALWPQRAGEQLVDTLHCAAACALMLAQTESDHSEAAGVRLSVRLGVSAGPLRALELGGLHRRRFTMLSGGAFDAAKFASEAADGGQVALDGAAWRRLAARGRGEELAPGCVRVLELDPAPVRLPRTELPLVQAELLAPYIPPPVMSREGLGQGAWLAELRRVSVVFVNLPALDDPADTDRVQEAVQTLQRQFHVHGATIAGVTVDAKGTSMLAATGLPPMSYDDDPVRAVRAAMAISHALQDQGQAGIGVSTGHVLCCPVGNQRRREYTIVGDVVNTAARLMQRALQGEAQFGFLLCDAATERETRRRIEWQRRGTIELKGKDNRVRTFEPVGRHAGIVVGDVETVGRRSERELIAAALAQARTGSAHLTVLEGEAGIGKSHLLAEALAGAAADGLRCLSGAGDPIERVAPYHAWRTVFATLLDAPVAADPASRAEHVKAAIPDALRPYAPLLNLILDLELPDTEESGRLQGERRTNATRRLLLDLLAEASHESLVIAIDDGHWLDSASWALIQEVVGRELPVCLILATRPGAGMAPEYEELLAQPGTQRAKLEPLETSESVAIVCERLGVDEIPESLVNLLAEKAGGNPLFTEELAYALRDNGVLAAGADAFSPAATRDLDRIALPDTVEGIIASRIDGLEPQAELVLKVASAVGLTFAPEIIHDVYPVPEERREISRSLDILVRRDLTLPLEPPPNATYSFRHPLMREVVYNRMLFSQRRELHGVLARWYEQRYAEHREQVYATLAHHWSRAGDVEKGCEYLMLASDQAFSNAMSREAVNLGLRAAELLGEPLPRDPEGIGALIEETVGAIATRMSELGVEGIAALPPATDPQKNAVIGVLLRTEPAIFVSKQVQLFVLVGLRNFLLTLEHGATPFTPGVVAIYAMLVRAMEGDPVRAFALSSLAERLADRDSPALRSYASFVHHRFVKHWLEPIGPDVDRLLDNVRSGFEYGDWQFACFNRALHVMHLALSGAPLDEVIASGTAAINEIAGRSVSAAYHSVFEVQFAKALAGRTVERCSLTDLPEEGTVEEERDVASVTRTDLYDVIGCYTTQKLRLHYLFREHRRAVAYGERTEQLLGAIAGEEIEPEFTFSYALALFARYEEDAREAMLEHARELADRVRGWERYAPSVFAHKRLALDGAAARATGDYEGAAELFVQAAGAARSIGFTHHVALAHELAGRTLIEAGDVAGARRELQASRQEYERWGARAKVDDVDQTLAELGA